jgi:hypothetical protein
MGGVAQGLQPLRAGGEFIPLDTQQALLALELLEALARRLDLGLQGLFARPQPQELRGAAGLGAFDVTQPRAQQHRLAPCGCEQPLLRSLVIGGYAQRVTGFAFAGAVAVECIAQQPHLLAITPPLRMQLGVMYRARQEAIATTQPEDGPGSETGQRRQGDAKGEQGARAECDHLCGNNPAGRWHSGRVILGSSRNGLR